MSTSNLPYTTEFTVSIAQGGTTGTTSEPCNPLAACYLRKVEAYSAVDAGASSFKVELLRYDTAAAAYFPIYESGNGAIPDDADWHEADNDTLNVPLNFAGDGNYTWRVTVDLACTAAMSIKIRRTIER